MPDCTDGHSSTMYIYRTSQEWDELLPSERETTRDEKKALWPTLDEHTQKEITEASKNGDLIKHKRLWIAAAKH